MPGLSLCGNLNYPAHNYQQNYSDMKNLGRENWLIILSFGIIYIVWGSTYLANWYAIQDIPPLLMSGTRFFIAGAILYGLSLILGHPKISRTQWKNAGVSGIMFLAIGTGGMVWAEQFIASGMLALMVASQPLLVLLLIWKMDDKKPSFNGLIGTGLGMVGMAFLVMQDQFISDRGTLIGLGVIFISLLSWGIASVRVAKLDMPSSKLQGAGLQMLIGGLALLLTGSLTGELGELDFSAITSRAVWSLVFLISFGSIVAFSAFNYLLLKSTPDKVVTANYVNPVVAMLLGWGLNNEEISNQSLLAAVLMLAGVVFISTNKSFLKKFRLARPHPIASLLPELNGGVKDLEIHLKKPKHGDIARIWQGKTRTEMAQEYLSFSKQFSVKSAIDTPGNLGVTVLHRTDGDVTYHTFVTYWEDMDAVRRYAREDYHKPRLFGDEQSYLLGSEGVVEHRIV